MSYDDSQLSTNPIYRVRFSLQDVDPSSQILSDLEISYLLGKYDDNEVLATVDAARKILTYLTSYTREEEGNVAVYGSDHYKQWAAHLNTLINGLTNTLPRVIIGGVDKTEVKRVNSDLNSHFPSGVGINTFFDEQYR